MLITQREREREKDNAAGRKGMLHECGVTEQNRKNAHDCPAGITGCHTNLKVTFIKATGPLPAPGRGGRGDANEQTSTNPAWINREEKERGSPGGTDQVRACGSHCGARANWLRPLPAQRTAGPRASLRRSLSDMALAPGGTRRPQLPGQLAKTLGGPLAQGRPLPPSCVGPAGRGTGTGTSWTGILFSWVKNPAVLGERNILPSS